MKDTLSITLCGDLCPTDDTIDIFLNNGPEKLFHDVLDVFQESDILFGNLEYVLTDNPIPIKKNGPILSAPTKTISILQKSGFDLLSLANNHIKDCGEEGVKSTIETCQKIKIDTFGAAANIEEAKKPFVKEINGFKIGFIAFAEQEFNTADEDSYGSSYFDPYEDLDLIEKTKTEVNYLIIIYHGGIEYFPYASPQLKKKCRRFVDKGADLVLCQHSHCIGSFEDYKESKILYGQGNTLFGYKNGNEQWNTGLIVKLLLKVGEKPEISFIPITAIQEGGIRLLKDKERESVLKQLEKRSLDMNNKDFLNSEWNSFVKKKSLFYLPYLLGFNRYLIHLNRFSNNRFVRLFYPQRKLKTSHNIIRCEAHNEVIQNILKNY